ncbi:MAG: ATPase [bacterium]|nr:ATPase [bacterium]
MEIKQDNGEKSELRRLETELEATKVLLQQTQAQLIHSEKMATIGMLVAGVAHEINSPIGALGSMHATLVKALEKLKCNLTCDGADNSVLNDPNVAATLAIIDEANRVITNGTLRVTSIVRRLRSFARIDEAERTVANIHEGIEDTLTLIDHEIKHKIQITRRFGAIPSILCYPGQLNQVFLNLLVNSRQAMENGGEISITTGVEKSCIRIDFADTGKGIAPELLDKVFEPGFTTKQVGVGTGLGLFIVRSIVQAHGGIITVKSEVDKGTTFTIFLPIDQGEAGVSSK